MIRNFMSRDIAGMCDWAEIQAWLSNRRTCTDGDVMKYVKPDDSLQDHIGFESESDADESIADDVMSMAVRRASKLGDLYPFEVGSRGTIKSKGRTSQNFPLRFQAYLFHLFFCVLEPSSISPQARHFFELESLDFLHDFFGGYAFHFGWTYKNSKLGKTPKRIESFCEAAGDLQLQPTEKIKEWYGQKNDLGIDCILWNAVPDGRENCLLVIGQCSTGRDGPKKFASSAAELFKDCFKETPTGPVINTFLTPFEVVDTNWRSSVIECRGLLFDRTRLVLGTENGRLYRKPSLKWLNECLKKPLR